MAFQIGPDESARDALARVAGELAESAKRNLDRLGDDPAEAVHEARRNIRSLRGLVRLVRGELGDEGYKHGNGLLRDAAHMLSGHRDAQVILAAFDRLAEEMPEEHRAALGMLRDMITPSRQSEAAVSDHAAAARVRLDQFLGSLKGWPALGEDAPRAVAKGLRRAAKRARKRYAAAREDPAPEKLHELRKRCKDVREQLRILSPLAPKEFGKLESRYDKVCDLLGEDRDLHLLSQTLAAVGAPTADAAEAMAEIMARAAARREKLVAKGLRRAESAVDVSGKALAEAVRDGWGAGVR